MQTRKLYLVFIILIFFLSSSVFIMPSDSKEESISKWNNDWSYNIELNIPIYTVNPESIHQPIDVKIKFDYPCWAKNELEHSIRVLCWDERTWIELESQIYNLDFSSSNHIKSCNLIFLIPDIANGKERYFIYYDDNEKPAPGYKDHVDIEDEYYYIELISGITAEGDYYKINQDGYCVYGVGQKGNVVDHKLSQCIINQKPETKNFDALNAYNIASFSFAYRQGNEDEDEISSDDKLISKQVITDGNLMVEFSIVSESANGEIRSTNVYKYYYCPDGKKRINVHVKHEVLKDITVSGMVNVDGRYGVLTSYKSKSERLHRMRFGDILPFLHVYDENDDIREYNINPNPESHKQEWVVSYEDDCDLGKKSWFSYDEGEEGNTHAIIFSSNSGIVKSGTDERDGISVKLAQREYIDVIGAEIDYAAISFTRNSYEKNSKHDLKIPDDLIVEFDAEFFTINQGDYLDVENEADIYQTLIKYRQDGENGLFGEDEKIHTLTVIPRFSARLLSHPFLRNITGVSISEIWGELYQDGKLIQVSYTNKPLFGPPNIKFPKLSAGNYTVKIYRRILNFNKSYIGIGSVTVEEDTKFGIYCTWQKDIKINCFNQFSKVIKDVEFDLYKNNTIVASNISDFDGILKLSAPFNLFDTYILKGMYKGFIIYEKELPMLQKNFNIKLDLYDIKFNVKDKLGMVPGVNVRPSITSQDMKNSIHLIPEQEENGMFTFHDLPQGSYEFQISYGSTKNVKNFAIPYVSEIIDVEFSALFNLDLDLFDYQGTSITKEDKQIIIERNGKTVYNSEENNEQITLPPGTYTINVYSNGKHIGLKTIELTNDKNVKIVATSRSIIPLLVTGLSIVFIFEMLALLIIKKISLNTFLKLLAMSLILISLFQPWWSLNASSQIPVAEKNTEMFIFPQIMIERLEYNNVKYLDVATIPEVFTDFVGVLLLVVISGFVLLGLSFVPNIILKRRFYKILIFASVLFLILVAFAFSYGMSEICEISLGSLEGEGTLDVLLPDGTKTYMNANWGLGIGFYLCILAALITIGAGIIDSLNRRGYFKQKKNKK